ncbi:MAG: peptidoglycan DD-metalloendopeptidase family protein [Parcubacteria group bacterium]
MSRNHQLLVLTFCAIVLSFFVSVPVVFAENETDLRNKIEAKSKELETLQSQINETQGKLDVISSQSKSLSREIQSTEYTIKNLELNIRGSEVNIDKLSLELQNLGIQLSDTEKMIGEKKSSIAVTIREINQKEKVGILETFLASQSLTDSVTELSDLDKLQASLSDDIVSLRNLSSLLGENIKETDSKKNNLENEQLNLKSRKAIVEDQKSYKETILKETKNQESAYQKQLSDLEKKQESINEEIESLEAALRKNFNAALAPGRGYLKIPFWGTHPLTQQYGATDFARTAYKTGFHNGIDYGMTIGTPILAAADGKVFVIGDNGRYQYGKFIVIKHDNNFFTLYAHLSRQAVSVGQSVTQGEIIGYSGNTGYATGPHLHFGVYQTMELKGFAGAGNVPVGVTMNPSDYF